MFQNPLEERGREGFATHAVHFFLKRRSLRALRAHALCPQTGCTSCAPTRGVPFMGFSSLGSQNMGDWSGGVEEGNERGAKSACPPEGDKIRIGSLSPAFWGAHKWAEILRHPCILGDPQQRGQNQSKKKQKQKIFHGVPDPAYSPADCPHWGLNQ